MLNNFEVGTFVNLREDVHGSLFLGRNFGWFDIFKKHDVFIDSINMTPVSAKLAYLGGDGKKYFLSGELPFEWIDVKKSNTPNTRFEVGDRVVIKHRPHLSSEMELTIAVVHVLNESGLIGYSLRQTTPGTTINSIIPTYYYEIELEKYDERKLMHPQTKVDTTEIDVDFPDGFFDGFRPENIRQKRKRILQDFVEANGWEVGSRESEIVSYLKKSSVIVEFADDEVVLVDDTGDFCHIEYTQPNSLYSLIGALINCGSISHDYVNG
jgi:hypothetical protein